MGKSTQSRTLALPLATALLLLITVSAACSSPVSTLETSNDEASGSGSIAPAGSSGAENYAQSPAPGAVVPNRLDGIDVSQFQGDIDWQAAKASGIVFAFARALEGETIHDSTFAANWQGMRQADVVRGAYDFYVASDPPEDQVEVFTDLVTLEPGDLVPMVDIEGASIGASAPPDLVTDFRQYLELMEAHYGVKPIIYTNPTFWNEYMDDSFGAYPLWVAEYEVESPTVPKGWESWMLWQHSESGAVAGVEGDVDLDVFNGGLEELARYRIPQPAGHN